MRSLRSLLSLLFLLFPITVHATYVVGNLGIGTTGPKNQLAVNGGVGIGTGVSSSYITTTAPAGGLLVQGNVGIGTVTPGNSLIVRGGNVGIGTNSPPQLLYVAGTGEFQGFKMTGNGVAAGYRLTSSSVGVGTWMPDTANTSVVNSGTANQFTYYATTGTAVSGQSILTTDGTNIGVSTASPTATLEVNGNFAVKGTTSNWTVKTPNPNTQICDTTCGTSMCAVGVASGILVNCTDTSAVRKCLCMGP